MIVVLHVTLALLSVALTTYAFIDPSRLKIKVSAWLVASTLISGTYLVLSTHSNMLKACLSGLIYLAVVSAGLAGAYHRLSSQEATN